VSEGFGARVRHEVGRKASKFLRKILRHCFPALFVGASSALHNSATGRGARASKLLSQQRENLALRSHAVFQDGTGFATGGRA
jgi:hypothetical protein